MSEVHKAVEMAQLVRQARAMLGNIPVRTSHANDGDKLDVVTTLDLSALDECLRRIEALAKDTAGELPSPSGGNGGV